MADTFPYRHRLTGKVQHITEDAASVFPDLLERLPDDYEQILAEKDAAEADVTATKSAPRSKAAREAKAHLAKAEKDADKIESAVTVADEKETTDGD